MRALRTACLAAAIAAAPGFGCGTVDVREDNEKLRSLTAALTGLVADLPPAAEAPAPADVLARLSGGPLGWTEENAVRAALLLHPMVRVELARVGIAKADLVQAGLLPNPTIGGNLVFAAAPPPVLFAFDAAQTLLLFGRIPIRQEAARAELERTILRSADALLADLAAVRRTWHELHNADRLLKLLAEAESITRRSLKTTTERKEAGAAGAVDVNLVETQVLLVQSEIAAAEGRRDALRAEFATRIGAPAWSADWSPAVAEIEPGPPPAETEALDTALRSRPDLQMADARIRQAEAELRTARLSPLPAPQVGVNVTRQPPVYVGPSLALEVPLFDQGLPRIARAEFVLAEARRDREVVELTARREVAVALAMLSADRRQVELLRTRGLPLAERNLALAQQAFQGGGANLLTIFASQAAFVDVRRRLLSASRDYRIHFVDLDRATGRWMAFPRTPATPEQPAPAAGKE